MSLYIIEDRYGALRDSSVNYKYAKSLQQRKYPDGHIVEMVPAKPKVQVSQEEAKMLKKAKDTTVWRPAAVISEYAYNAAKDSDPEALLEDHLMRAYVIGWTVAKPKRYVLPMDGTKLADGTIAYATLDHTGVWTIKAYSKKQSAVAFHNTVTQADIDAAPDWVRALKPVEVTDDGMGC